jgi:tetratricopeptide (TPR) repeat protein
MSDTWTDRLSAYLDDELSPADRTALEAHLAACPECTATLEELRAVVARAGALTPRPPSTDLWSGIEARVQSPATVLPMRERAARRFSFTLPQLIAASLAMMVLSGSAVWVIQHGGRATSLPPVAADTGAPSAPEHALHVALPDPHYDEAVSDLEQALENGRAQLDPQTVKILEQNLDAIDRAIDQSRRALEQDPANIYLNNHLAEAKQRKLSLLRRATALASTKG